MNQRFWVRGAGLCVLILASGFVARTEAAASQDVSGERQFSSGHPAMQALNPAIYEIFVQYRH